MFKAVIFDMDGVIINSEPLHFEVEDKLFRSLGLKIPSEEHNSFVGTTSFLMWTHIKNKYALLQSVADLIKISRNAYIDHLKTQVHIKPVKGVMELIRDLYENDIKLVLASSSPISHINFILEKFKMHRFFHRKISGDQVEKGKPAPDIFLYSAETLCLSPSDCIVIEDSKNGVIAAREAGMLCIGYNNPDSGNQDLSSASKIINSFSEIDYKWLKKFYGNVIINS